MPEKLELAPDFWRKRAAEARRLAKLIEDDFAGETLLEIARQYDELVEHAKRRQRPALVDFSRDHHWTWADQGRIYCDKKRGRTDELRTKDWCGGACGARCR